MTSDDVPDDDHAWIGRRIGEHRRRRGWTLAILAERVGLSSTQLSRIESGSRLPSLGTLPELARAFGVSLSALVAQERPADVQVVRAAERRPRAAAGGALAMLSGTFPRLQAVCFSLPVGAASPAARHSGEEWIYVLRGTIEFGAGDESVVLEAGDAAHFRSDAAHGMRNVGVGPADVLVVSENPR